MKMLASLSTGHVANDVNVGHHQSSKVFFDPNYFRSASGILKIAQAIVSLLGYICMKSVTGHYHFPAGGYYEFVTFVAFFVAIISGILHSFHITDVTSPLHWLLLEMIYAFVWSLLFCIAGGIVAAFTSYHTALGASCFFAFLGTLLYGYEAVEMTKRRLREDSRSDHQRSRGGSCVTIT